MEDRSEELAESLDFVEVLNFDEDGNLKVTKVF